MDDLTLYAQLPPMRLPDATVWPLPGGRSIGAHWDVARRRWEVLELGFGLELLHDITADRGAAEALAQAARVLLLLDEEQAS